jgi:hypothetical protein
MSRPRFRFHPRLEGLENRLVPAATFAIAFTGQGDTGWISTGPNPAAGPPHATGLGGGGMAVDGGAAGSPLSQQASTGLVGGFGPAGVDARLPVANAEQADPFVAEAAAQDLGDGWADTGTAFSGPALPTRGLTEPPPVAAEEGGRVQADDADPGWTADAWFNSACFWLTWRTLSGPCWEVERGAAGAPVGFGRNAHRRAGSAGPGGAL